MDMDLQMLLEHNMAVMDAIADMNIDANKAMYEQGRRSGHK